jgi:hypothetical protein
VRGQRYAMRAADSQLKLLLECSHLIQPVDECTVALKDPRRQPLVRHVENPPIFGLLQSSARHELRAAEGAVRACVMPSRLGTTEDLLQKKPVIEHG